MTVLFNGRRCQPDAPSGRGEYRSDTVKFGQAHLVKAVAELEIVVARRKSNRQLVSGEPVDVNACNIFPLAFENQLIKENRST